jgi:hypothetical protein
MKRQITRMVDVDPAIRNWRDFNKNTSNISLFLHHLITLSVPTENSGIFYFIGLITTRSMLY